MRCKKNITCNVRNITLSLLILILSLVNIILCFSNYNNTSALDYSSNVGIGFTFNPTLSVSLSSSGLVIPNLAPGNTLDSNVINVSVASNASYGYILSAIVNGNNNDLTHSNGTNAFSSIAIDADLADLEDSEDTNIWGYSTSLDSGTTWSNYNGLSNSNSAILLDTNTNNTETGIDSIDFKIGAKASSTQASGTYTGVINFTAVTKHIPVTLAEAYASEGKTMINGFYTMQDMTSTICSKVEAIGAQLQVLDKRDNKLYWIAKLADNHCWMTQNLDLNLSHDRPLTSEDTDLNDSSLAGAYSAGYSYDPDNRILSWRPTNTTGAWNNNDKIAYSRDPGEWYWDGEDDTLECNYLDPSKDCVHFIQNEVDVNKHLSVGNYYNWPAAIASDDAASLKTGTYNDTNLNPKNSICPKGWRLPTISNASYGTIGSTSEFGRLNYLYNKNKTDTDVGWVNNPLWFVRSGYFNYGSPYKAGREGAYWSSTVYGGNPYAYRLSIYASSVNPAAYMNYRALGYSVRCLAK